MPSTAHARSSATSADIAKARAKLGYDPKAKIEQGIPLFIDWFKRNSL
jgi:nucleoside-diphosphate-sugar epimerase